MVQVDNLHWRRGSSATLCRNAELTLMVTLHIMSASECVCMSLARPIPTASLPLPLSPHSLSFDLNLLPCIHASIPLSLAVYTSADRHTHPPLSKPQTSSKVSAMEQELKSLAAQRDKEKDRADRLSSERTKDAESHNIAMERSSKEAQGRIEVLLKELAASKASCGKIGGQLAQVRVDRIHE